MYKLITIIGIQLLFFCTEMKAQDNNGAYVAAHIADKMRDSLGLSSLQRDSIYAINIVLHNRKTAVRQQYKQIDSLQKYISYVERSRDSMYIRVLGIEKFTLYRQKKRYLVSIN